MTRGHSPDDEPSPLVRFYLGAAPDSRDRWIEDIWTWDHNRLEGVHDYIQWLFPLPTRSRFNMDAPLLSRSDIEAFRGSERLRAQLHTSLQVMLRFYGLQQTQSPVGDPRVVKGADWEARFPNWLTPGNHNHLRLTRILTSTHLLGLEREAAALQACLLDIAGECPRAVTRDTVAFWQGALSALER